MASGQARVALRSLSATPLGYGVLPVRTSMYIPKRKGEAQLSVQHGAPRERCCDPPAHPFLCFWVSALLCRLSCIKRWVQRTAVPVSSQLFNGRWATPKIAFFSFIVLRKFAVFFAVLQCVLVQILNERHFAGRHPSVNYISSY